MLLGFIAVAYFVNDLALYLAIPILIIMVHTHTSKDFHILHTLF